MSSIHSNTMEKKLAKGSLPMSPIAKSPILKSPMPKSPMPKSPGPYTKYKSRCAYGLLCLFHFRQSRSKKLISDRKHLGSYAVDSRYARHRLDLLRNIDKKCQRMDDGVDQKTKVDDSGSEEVKKITGESVSIENKIKKTNSASKVQHAKSDPELVGEQSGNNRKPNKTVRRRHRLPIYGCYDVSTMGHQKSAHQELVDRSLKKIDSAVKAKALSTHMHPEHGRDCTFETKNEINFQVRLNEAAEAFINQKLIDGKHLNGNGANRQSEHFLEALEILNSNKDLFIKLLQDPNSLLVKHIEDLRDSQANTQQNKLPAEAELSEDRTSNARESRNFKSSDSCQSSGTRDPQSLEKIVVLRTGRRSLANSVDKNNHDSSQVNYSLKTVRQSVKPSIFQFERMKRKLMRTMGIARKEQQLALIDSAVHKCANDFEECDTGMSVEVAVKNPTDKSSSDFEEMILSSLDIDNKDRIEKMKKYKPGIEEEAASSSESSHENLNSPVIRQPKKNKCEKFVETRIHLSEFNSGNVNFSRNQRPKTWDGISSLLEYDFLPMVSPRRKKEAGLFTPKMRFSPHNNYKVGSDNWRNLREEKNRCSSPLRQDLDALLWAENREHGQLHIVDTKSNSSGDLFTDFNVHENISSFNGNLGPRDSKDWTNAEEINPFGVTSELGGALNNSDTDGTSLDFSKLDLPVESQMLTPSICDYSSSPSSIRRVEDYDSAKETEQPSPISVLDQFSMEDIMSPFSAESGHDESPVLPLQIGIEDDYLAALLESSLNQKISSSVEEHGSALEYISKVLQASGLNWDELSLKCHSLDQVLDQSQFDETDLQSNQFYGDKRLLFGYVNELLLKLHQCHFRCSPWVSFIKPKVKQVMITENLVHEVKKLVDLNLFLKTSQHTLEHLIQDDLNKSGTWMDIRIDAEDVVCEMAESILDELVYDTAMQ